MARLQEKRASIERYIALWNLNKKWNNLIFKYKMFFFTILMLQFKYKIVFFTQS